MSLIEIYSFYSYLSASVAYFLLLAITIIEIKKKIITFPFIAALAFSLLWAAFTAFAIKSDVLFTSETLPFETLRNCAWFVFLSCLICNQQYNNQFSLLLRSKLSYATLLLVGFTLYLEIFADLRYQINQIIGLDIRLFAHLIFAIIGLALVEQVYRNATPEQRWAVKFICIGIAASFIMDFIIYSKSLLFVKMDFKLWNSRGFINALIVPLLAISFRRLRNDKTVITASRHIVFHTTVLLGTGLYLLLMSLAGYYIRDYGGNWGEVAQLFFIFLAILLLLVLLFSGKIRALTKVYFNKHFFRYSYDYRDEWLKLSKNIAQLDSVNELSGFVIKTMAKLVDSAGGALWLKNEQGDFCLAEEVNLGFTPLEKFNKDSSLSNFLINKQWVIDFYEFNNAPEIYAEVDLSPWSEKIKQVWLIIPLFRHYELEAFVVLTQARVYRKLNWEDHDLLKTVGLQLTNALALRKASDELSRARQFEAYNRLSAYLVHDLKNLVAQISLLVKNAEKHKRNPEFIDDSIDTLENVAKKMQHLVTQLKMDPIQNEDNTLIDLVDVIHDVALQQASNKPLLKTISALPECRVRGKKDRMTAILGHLVQNAQEATDNSGSVKLELSKNGALATVKIIDNGTGMDKKFINERLFKPFDTTKGNAGMGIGVYEARDYILKNSGHISVKSMPGMGTTFIISLPLAT